MSLDFCRPDDVPSRRNHYVSQERYSELTLATLMARCIPEPNSGCWLWEGSVIQGPACSAYGTIRFDGSVTTCHRVMWVLTQGPIPVGLWVLHKCDVPSCINPGHLFLGTPSDNTQDMIRKGRRVQGIRLLEVAQILEIYRSREETKHLAALYDVGVSTINKIRAGSSCGRLTRGCGPSLNRTRGAKVAASG